MLFWYLENKIIFDNNIYPGVHNHYYILHAGRKSYGHDRIPESEFWRKILSRPWFEPATSSAAGTITKPRMSALGYQLNQPPKYNYLMLISDPLYSQLLLLLLCLFPAKVGSAFLVSLRQASLICSWTVISFSAKSPQILSIQFFLGLIKLIVWKLRNNPDDLLCWQIQCK